MKKIVNIILLFIICLFPIVGNAKTNLTYEWKVENNYFFDVIDGKYYFTDDDQIQYAVYNKDGVLEEVFQYEFLGPMKVSEFYEDEFLSSSMKFNRSLLRYSSELDIYYSIDYGDGEVLIYGEMTDDDPQELYFDDENDADSIKNIIGKEYDIINGIYEEELDIDYYNYEEGFYVVWCYNDDYDFYKIFNEDGELVYSVRFLYEERIRIHIHNGKLYRMDEDTKLSVYNLDGELIETLNLFDDLNDLYPDNGYILGNFYFDGNNLMIQYYLNINSPATGDNPKGMTTARSNRNLDVNDNVKEDVESDYPYSVALKYRLGNDLTLVSTKNGTFTADRKVDENDREYIELKLSPNEGYVLEKIIVTDAEGNKIDVVDNKFYMPDSDVTIEVRYIGGEYLPIPDTGLGKSITLILIGLILIGVGFYTFNYARQE